MNDEVQDIFEAYEYLKDISERIDLSNDEAEQDSLVGQRLEAEGRLNRLFKKAIKAALLE